MTIPRHALAFWNDVTHQWQTDAGSYTFLIGASSADIRGKVSAKL
jgi:hypothetical protein